MAHRPGFAGPLHRARVGRLGRPVRPPIIATTSRRVRRDRRPRGDRRGDRQRRQGAAPPTSGFRGPGFQRPRWAGRDRPRPARRRVARHGHAGARQPDRDAGRYARLDRRRPRRLGRGSDRDGQDVRPARRRARLAGGGPGQPGRHKHVYAAGPGHLPPPRSGRCARANRIDLARQRRRQPALTGRPHPLPGRRLGSGPGGSARRCRRADRLRGTSHLPCQSPGHPGQPGRGVGGPLGRSGGHRAVLRRLPRRAAGSTEPARALSALPVAGRGRRLPRERVVAGRTHEHGPRGPRPTPPACHEPRPPARPSRRLPGA